MMQISGMEPQASDMKVEIGPYTLISFRIGSQPLAGARYIRVGDFKTDLLEMKFSQYSMTLAGLTLISVGTRGKSGFAGGDTARVGLPVFRLPKGKEFSDKDRLQRIDIESHLEVFWDEATLDVKIAKANRFDMDIHCGRLSVLSLGDELVGFRVSAILSGERQWLEAYFSKLQ